MNHEWTPMDTNVRHLSTEYTEETECLADVGHDAEDSGWTWHVGLQKIRMASVCSAVVIASRGGNGIMRKFMVIVKIFAKNKKMNDSSTIASPPSAMT